MANEHFFNKRTNNILSNDIRSLLSRSVSFYKTRDDNDLCLKWSTLLIRALKTALETSMHNTTTEKLSLEQTLAEVTALRGFGLSKAGERKESIKATKEAWTMSKTPFVFTAFFQSHFQNHIHSQDPDEKFLADLDEKLAHFMHRKGCSTTETDSRTQLLKVFASMVNACLVHNAEGGRLLLEIQNRWILYLIGLFECEQDKFTWPLVDSNGWNEHTLLLLLRSGTVTKILCLLVAVRNSS
eukprot:CAMPEP_0118718688 /NCGR_PEP_ID=MMETSP0800-20121206/28955_1 /TAXON_ID=210618 ORGANISM="Striatella unipunctata, Strain CCMP2910" /NCGR_SAMPLE_ID=MMETSP0800 /ASSEMBLY_ACC=CAM_ASM_000638 /LENGTH=240 /DNA_ID=CAMNT_0006625767 /DNA_START=99 /DNA_END=817 /DNA_ORIENTATION=+